MPRKKKEAPTIDPVWKPIDDVPAFIEKLRSEYPLTDRDNDVLSKISVAYIARNIEIEERRFECIEARMDSEQWPDHINYPFDGHAFVYDIMDHEGDDPNPPPFDYIIAVFTGRVAALDKTPMFELITLKKGSIEEEKEENEKPKRKPRTRKSRDPEPEHGPIEKPKRKRGRPRKVKDA